VARVALLGGTFNPPHLAHLLCASEAADQLGLDRVILMPVFTPPHKEVPEDPGPEVRLELCELAVAGDDRLAVSRLEIDRGGPSFTVDTLKELNARQPEHELIFIVGGDMAVSLPTWKDPRTVLELATLGVAERSGATRRDITERLTAEYGDDVSDRLTFFDMPRMDISSSEVRRRVAAGRTIRYLVPDAVADHIAEHGLYARKVAADDYVVGRQRVAGRPAARLEVD
jgi:nicotinate-nucleotide adenylyltransferase